MPPGTGNQNRMPDHRPGVRRLATAHIILPIATFCRLKGHKDQGEYKIRPYNNSLWRREVCRIGMKTER